MLGVIQLRFYFLLVLASLCVGRFANFKTNQAFSRYLGPNVNYFWGDTSLTPTGSNWFAPFAVTIGPSKGYLFIADLGWNRVLRLPSSARTTQNTFTDDEVMVLGPNPAFNTNLKIWVTEKFCNDQGLNGPSSMYVDSNGTLWVADTGNSRVVGFSKAEADAREAGSAFDLWRGVDTANCSEPYTFLRTPISITPATDEYFFAIDSTQLFLFSTDPSESPVPPIAQLLEPCIFTINSAPILTDSCIFEPQAIIYDPITDRLYLYDRYRLLIFFKALEQILSNNIPTGVVVPISANLVLMQPTFSSDLVGCTSSIGTDPGPLLIAGRTLISIDSGASRILIWNDVANLENGVGADVVLNQPDFYTCPLPDWVETFTKPLQLGFLTYDWDYSNIIVPDGYGHIVFWHGSVTSSSAPFNCHGGEWSPHTFCNCATAQRTCWWGTAQLPNCMCDCNGIDCAHNSDYPELPMGEMHPDDCSCNCLRGCADGATQENHCNCICTGLKECPKPQKFLPDCSCGCYPNDTECLKAVADAGDAPEYDSPSTDGGGNGDAVGDYVSNPGDGAENGNSATENGNTVGNVAGQEGCINSWTCWVLLWVTNVLQTSSALLRFF